WWVWGLSQWIGGGWCHVEGSKARAVRSRSRPDLDGDGQGVHKKMPNAYARGQGNGVHTGNPSAWRKRLVLGHGGRGVVSPTASTPPAAPSRQLLDLQGIGSGGVHRQTLPQRRPRSRSAGVSAEGFVASRLPSLGNMRGVHGDSKAPCADWFAAIQERLRRVRIV